MTETDRVSHVLIRKRDDLIDVISKYNIDQVRIFGSVARNCDHDESDIDFLIQMPKDSSLIDYSLLKKDIEDELQVKTDILTYTGLDEEVLNHFKENSISLDEIKSITDRREILSAISSKDILMSNLKSIIWVINRIEKQMENQTKEDVMKSELLQDALTRNVQLLSQVASQITEKDWKRISSFQTRRLRSMTVLKDALFMNVDFVLLWKTLTTELLEIKEGVTNELKIL